MKKLLDWYDRCGRNLPWRKTRDPYKILVSEIMLQQTQVDRVLLFYKNWLTQFPTWKRLASATTSEVIHAWAGLGYNRRALMLRDIAKHVEKNGIPKKEETWRSLKGIGIYTAAAISAFAFEQPTLPIDTNIRRVLGRFFFGTPYPQPALDKHILVWAKKSFLNQPRAHDVPQALFDLATDVCKKVPTCAVCPLRAECKAAIKFLSGHVRVPKQMIKKTVERRHDGKAYPDRIYRGRILKLVREKKKLRLEDVGPNIDKTFSINTDGVWVYSMIKRLETEKFIKIQRGILSLCE